MDSAALELAALEIARFFLLHLQEELTKSGAVMDAAGPQGKTPRTINLALTERLHAEFPTLRSLPPAPYNLFRRWVERNAFLHGYDGYAYHDYNVIFAQRLTCLHRWSVAERQAFHDVALATFRALDTRRAGFSVSFFLRVENNMRELLRELILALPGVDTAAVWGVVYQQSLEYQEVINHFFETLLQEQFDESERLLLNILPASISAELKRNGKVRPVAVEQATVLFTDFAGFTELAGRMAPDTLVDELDLCFSLFDQIIDEHGLEKIKTIGDSYMCAAGIPEPKATHVEDAALAALRMRDAVQDIRAQRALAGAPYWNVRIGIHTGPLTAGVIGRKKFSYDIWGDTVNVASRMESSGAPGRINVSAAVAARLEQAFVLQPRGLVAAKSKGDLEMFFLESIQPACSQGGLGTAPNAQFTNVMAARRG